MQLQLAPLIGASTRGGGEGARLYTAMAAVTVMFSPHREINGTVLDHRLHARAAEQSLLVYMCAYGECGSQLRVEGTTAAEHGRGLVTLNSGDAVFCSA